MCNMQLWTSSSIKGNGRHVVKGTIKGHKENNLPTSDSPEILLFYCVLTCSLFKAAK